jgi:hypothetical protein
VVSFTPQPLYPQEKSGWLQMYVQWQRLSVVEARQTEKSTRNAGDSVATCQNRTATAYDVGLKTVQEMQ